MSGGLASKGLSTGFVMDAVWEGRVHAGGRLVNGAGDLVNGLCNGLADGSGGPLWERRVHAGGRVVNGAGDLVNRLCHGLADENGRSALGGRESMREGG